MGLAPYGEPKYAETILNEIIDVKDDGSFHMDMDFFNYCQGFTMTNSNFDRLFGGPPRRPEAKLTQRDMDIAASIQKVTEEIALKIGRYVYAKTGKENLCLAGGVALNCVANGKLKKESPFKNIWVQPASGDAGGALGAALAVWHHYLDKPREVNCVKDSMFGAYLGPAFSNEEIKNYLEKNAISYKGFEGERLCAEVALRLQKGEVVGWFQGRMEFGPRALGARSIIGDARNPGMQKKMNLKIKYRESFRPFAPSVLREHASEWFDYEGDSSYMLMVADIKDTKKAVLSAEQERLFGIDKLNVRRSEVPAVTHVDYSARIQTVDGEYNRKYYAMIESFFELTGCPVIINTSFNVRGEPIVCTPEDAYRCFMRTEMDTLVLENCVLEKKGQPAWNDKKDWKNRESFW